MRVSVTSHVCRAFAQPSTPRLFPFIDVLSFAGFRFSIFVDVSGARDGGGGGGGGAAVAAPASGDAYFGDARVLLACDAVPRVLRDGVLWGFSAWGEAARDVSAYVGAPPDSGSCEVAVAQFVPVEAKDAPRAVHVVSRRLCGRGGRCGPSGAEACLNCIDGAARAAFAMATAGVGGSASGDGGPSVVAVTKCGAPGGVLYFFAPEARCGFELNKRAAILAGCAVWGPALYVRARRPRVPRVESDQRVHVTVTVEELSSQWCGEAAQLRSHNALLRDARRRGVSRRHLGLLYSCAVQRKAARAARAPTLSHFVGEAYDRDAASRTSWQCDTCNAHNPGGASKCSSCSAPDTRAAQLHERALPDWSCTECTFINTGSRSTRCNMCDAPLAGADTMAAAAALVGSRSAASKRSRTPGEECSDTAASSPPERRMRRGHEPGGSSLSASTSDGALAAGGDSVMVPRGEHLHPRTVGVSHVPEVGVDMDAGGGGGGRLFLSLAENVEIRRGVAQHSSLQHSRIGTSVRAAQVGPDRSTGLQLVMKSSPGAAAAADAAAAAGAARADGGGAGSSCAAALGVVCPACTFVNLRQAEMSCGVCGFVFDGGPAPTVDQFDAFSQANSSPHAAGSLGVCSAYDSLAEFDFADAASTRVAVAGDDGGASDDGHTWICHLCTFSNDGGDYCGACACGNPSAYERRRSLSRERYDMGNGESRAAIDGSNGHAQPVLWVCKFCGVGDVSSGVCALCDESAGAREPGGSLVSSISCLLLTEMVVRALKECIFFTTRGLLYEDSSLSPAACVGAVISEWCRVSRVGCCGSYILLWLSALLAVCVVRSVRYSLGCASCRSAVKVRGRECVEWVRFAHRFRHVYSSDEARGNNRYRVQLGQACRCALIMLVIRTLATEYSRCRARRRYRTGRAG